MIAAIMQPTFLPWIGYFDLIDRVDRFVFFDDAQVLKRSWGVRNRILGAQGECFLTVPLIGHSQNAESTFARTTVDPALKWRRTHLATIRHAYAKAPFFPAVFDLLEDLFAADHTTIGALNMAFIEAVCERIGIDTSLVRSSQLAGIEGRKDHRLLSICNALGADTYLSAQGSAAYIEQDREGGAFAGSGVELRYHNFEHPLYPQPREAFVSHMSIVDLLMNCGFGSSLDIIRSGRRQELTSAQLTKIAA